MNNDRIFIANLRQEYLSEPLDLNSILENPFDQFNYWFQEALKAELTEPNAMTLATCTPDGKPSARIVLLKKYDSTGFTFYTNYQSHKGQELLKNPHAALVICWLELARQIRIEGEVIKISAKDSEQYFQSRPKDSQIGAWVSPQSKVLENRQSLEDKLEALKAQYANDSALPCPPHWGGYLVKPYRIEFWQGRPNRLHDRFNYSLLKDGNWVIERLAP